MNQLNSMVKLSFKFMVAVVMAGCVSNSKEAEIWNNDKRADVHVRLGSSYAAQGQLRTAQEELEKALEISPNYALGNHAMALLQIKLNQPDKARHYFESSVRVNADDPAAAIDYAGYLCKEGEYDKADIWYQKAISNPLNKNPEISYAGLGLCSIRRSNYERAEELLRQSLNINPKYPPALIGMAKISSFQGKAMSTRAYLQRFLEVANESPDVLLLAVETELKLGDTETASAYAIKLRSKFSKSPEAVRVDQVMEQFK